MGTDRFEQVALRRIAVRPPAAASDGLSRSYARRAPNTIEPRRLVRNPTTARARQAAFGNRAAIGLVRLPARGGKGQARPHETDERMALSLAQFDPSDSLPSVRTAAAPRRRLRQRPVQGGYQQGQESTSYALSRSATPRYYRAVGRTGERSDDYEHRRAYLPADAEALFARSYASEATGSRRSSEASGY